MKKILLIDENLLENLNFIEVLKNEYDVDSVGYIKAARERLQSPDDYTLIVLDIMMPTLDLFGLDETSDGLRTGLVYYEKELKQLDIPVLFWSWNADFEEEVKNQKETKHTKQNTDFLLKLDDENHLLKGVNSFLNGLKKQKDHA